MFLAFLGVRPHMRFPMALVESVMMMRFYSRHLTASSMAVASASWGVCFLLMRKSRSLPRASATTAYDIPCWLVAAASVYTASGFFPHVLLIWWILANLLPLLSRGLIFLGMGEILKASQVGMLTALYWEVTLWNGATGKCPCQRRLQKWTSAEAVEGIMRRVHLCAVKEVQATPGPGDRPLCV